MGNVYNDLKLDNLVLDCDASEMNLYKTDDDIFDQLNVNLIDFGCMTSFTE